MAFSKELTRQLGITHPILLAPMDVVSGSRLTAAVSRAGGFGILGGGYGDRDWLRRELAALRGLLSGEPAPFGVGFITWSLAKQPELLEVALAARPRAIMLSFGDPRPFAAAIKKAGAMMICQVQSEALAEEALDAGADVLVAQGTEAGGHGADRSTIDIVPAIVDLVAGRFRSSPPAASPTVVGSSRSACSGRPAPCWERGSTPASRRTVRKRPNGGSARPRAAIPSGV